jgi:hypothetical protein
VTGWRFSDRGWFVNHKINLRSQENRRLVTAELEFPNIAFGVHRWFFGGGSPDLVAIATPARWGAELARGRPGDNLLLISLRRVAELALAHVGELTSRQPPALASHEETIRAFLADTRRGQIALVHRYSPRPGRLVCHYGIFWDPEADGWDTELWEWSQAGGELWLFDNELVWQDHERRAWGTQPPEEWEAQHGLCLVDGYVPDEQGRVVCGGAY